jgi:hypothetical protein
LWGGESRWGRKRQSMDQNFLEKKKPRTHTLAHTTQICCKILKMDFRDRQLHVLGKQLKESCRNGKTKRPVPTLSPRHWTALTQPTHAHAVKRITQFFCALLTYWQQKSIFFFPYLGTFLVVSILSEWISIHQLTTMQVRWMVCGLETFFIVFLSHSSPSSSPMH